MVDDDVLRVVQVVGECHHVRTAELVGAVDGLVLPVRPEDPVLDRRRDVRVLFTGEASQLEPSGPRGMTSKTVRAKGWARTSADCRTLFLLSPFRSTLLRTCSLESTQYSRPLIRSGPTQNILLTGPEHLTDSKNQLCSYRA